MITARRFAGLTAIVTGAGQGIGRALTAALADEGALVVAVDRSSIVAELVCEFGADRVRSAQVDLETYAGATEAAAAALGWSGRIDVLINNVGGTIWARPFEHYTPQQIELELRRSLLPTLWCCHAVLPTMIAAGRGAIVNVSSVATRGLNRAPYGAAKGGVNALTACLALENAQRGIRVNAVATGGTDAPPRRVPRNPQPPTAQEASWYQQVIDQTVSSSWMHRYGSIAEQVRAILFLASSEASYITGTVLPVGGGDQG